MDEGNHHGQHVMCSKCWVFKLEWTAAQARRDALYKAHAHVRLLSADRFMANDDDGAKLLRSAARDLDGLLLKAEKELSEYAERAGH